MVISDRVARWVQRVALVAIGALMLASLVGMVWVIP